MHFIKRSFIYAIISSGGIITSLPAQTTPGTFTSVSAGSWRPGAAPNSIAAGFGSGFAPTTTNATVLPLPTTLGGVSLTIKDSAGQTSAASLFLTASNQINYLIPAGVALGNAVVTVSSGGSTFQGNIDVSNVAPAIFTADASGTGPPAAQVLRVSNGVGSLDPAPFNPVTPGSPATTSTIRLTPFTDGVYLLLYGTGIRAHSANPVKATVGGVGVPVLYAGPQGLAGLDQINIGPLPRSLAGRGPVSLAITVDGIPVNSTSLNIQ